MRCAIARCFWGVQAMPAAECAAGASIKFSRFSLPFIRVICPLSYNLSQVFPCMSKDIRDGANISGYRKPATPFICGTRTVYENTTARAACRVPLNVCSVLHTGTRPEGSIRVSRAVFAQAGCSSFELKQGARTCFIVRGFYSQSFTSNSD
jgi:hypothetical protein